MIAIENKTNVFAYGNSAYEMYEKAPDKIKISYPLNSGVIADIEHMETLVKLFITDQMKGSVKPCEVYIASEASALGGKSVVALEDWDVVHLSVEIGSFVIPRVENGLDGGH